MREQRHTRPRPRRHLGGLRHDGEDDLVMGRAERERHVRGGTGAAQRGEGRIVDQGDGLERHGVKMGVAREDGAVVTRHHVELDGGRDVLGRGRHALSIVGDQGNGDNGIARLIRVPDAVAAGTVQDGGGRQGGENEGSGTWLHEWASCDSAFFAMRGVMKIRSSVFFRLIDLFLNSQPRPGILDRPGTPAWVTESFSLKMPPMTSVPPSATRIWVAARSVIIVGTWPTRLTKSG